MASSGASDDSSSFGNVGLAGALPRVALRSRSDTGVHRDEGLQDVPGARSVPRLRLQRRQASGVPPSAEHLQQAVSGEDTRSKRRKTARERREQRLRAEARTVQRLLLAFNEVAQHRGNSLSRLGNALKTALVSVSAVPRPGEPKRPSVTPVPPPPSPSPLPP